LAVAGWEGAAEPGGHITLKADGSRGTGLHYRWTQTAGTAVILDDPAARTARCILPTDLEGPLEFLLVAGNSAGLASATVTIPAQAHSQDYSELRADAGDDQIGLVGNQLTLNGSASEPRRRLGYRWIQTGGPAVRLKVEAGPIFSFVPPAPGLYRFALLVAAGNRISEPDVVQVAVGAGRGPGDEPAPHALETAQDVARSALASIRGAVEAAEGLAQALAVTADRMNLYSTYAEAYREMARRLEPVLPDDPSRRAIWTERLFGPLTARLVEEMRAEGLDLRFPDTTNAPLTSAQRARLAEFLRSLADGFRSAQPGDRSIRELLHERIPETVPNEAREQ
jgi:hypothetical protein